MTSLSATTVSKERLQQFGAAAGEHSAAHIHLMIQLRMIHNLHHGMHRARLRIVGPVNQAFDPSMH